jgi:hypothetical protein
MAIMSERFSRLQLKGNAVEVHKGVKKSLIGNVFDSVDSTTVPGL